MITINSAPIQDKILLDANDSIISITSSNGIGYYFRVKIFIDTVFFDEQSWSRKDDTTAEKNLKKLYSAYYETIFNPAFANGLTQQNHLLKKVSIVINEHSIGDDSLVQTISLSDFYFMYNVKPIYFIDDNSFQFLGINPDVFQIPTNGKISLPFLVNTNNEIVKVELKDNTGAIIDSIIIPAFTDKRVYLYNFDLSTIALSANILYLTLYITVGASSFSKIFKVLKFPKFPIKEIAFLNNFGFWIYVYLDGQLSIDNNLDIKTYEELDTTEKVFEINEKQTYSINTGALLTSEKDIINQIATALEAKIVLNSEWISMINSTKKINKYKDRNNLYTESLTFSVKQNQSIPNSFGIVLQGVYDSDYYDSNNYLT